LLNLLYVTRPFSCGTLSTLWGEAKKAVHKCLVVRGTGGSNPPCFTGESSTNPTAGGACVFRCWIALDDLKIGAKIRDAIDEEIRIRDKLIVILSEAAIRSDWVKAEVSKAFAKERGRNKAHAEQRERKKTVLFPIRIDDAVGTTSEPWARRLRDEYNIWDFRSWPEPAAYQKNLNRLLRDLKTNETK